MLSLHDRILILLQLWTSSGYLLPRTDWLVSQSHIATDGQSVSKSWCRAQIFITVLTVTVLFFCGAPSLMRVWVCVLYMLLALASTVFLRSDSLGTRDHILLSQIWDFPFRRLLWLAGLRWRYSTPPPHGYHCLTGSTDCLQDNSSAWTPWKTLRMCVYSFIAWQWTSYCSIHLLGADHIENSFPCIVVTLRGRGGCLLTVT
jgi:hypothetical protein